MISLFPAVRRVALACTLASTLVAAAVRAQDAAPAAPAASAAPEPPAPPAPPDPPPGAVKPVSARPDAEVQEVPAPTPARRPVFALGTETYFISPVLSIVGGLQSENLLVNPNTQRESRVTTLAISRFGLEGRVGPYVTFRSEFERNLGAHGSSIWEGTASLSVRDQYLRLQRWGFTVDAGIILDPSSVDFFSAHIGDLLVADKYTRNTLLYSGFNRGQGVQLRYTRWGFTAGLSYTEANPLSSSASYMVGGSFGGNSRFWERPLSSFRNGQPDDEIQFRVVSPSLTYEHPVFEAKAMAQVFNINYQASSRDDPPLTGYNLRGNLMLKLKGLVPSLPFDVRPFVNVARVENDVLNSAVGYANQLLGTRFNALTWSAGLDVLVAGRSGIGFNYARVSDHTPSFVPPSGSTASYDRVVSTDTTFINLGATWWITEQVALGARVASYSHSIDANPELYEHDLSAFVTARLVL